MARAAAGDSADWFDSIIFAAVAKAPPDLPRAGAIRCPHAADRAMVSCGDACPPGETAQNGATTCGCAVLRVVQSRLTPGARFNP